ncbi:hypothetical protein [Pseudarthrobacter sp. PS3-L1]|uniref:hypothetical protein n=1 Tax=Pseudarthrobacter sp. PS3-L1 TaxID=3046207 RepID=UPI0024BB5B7E|nr:hypothetical protein [Pseudarthrobacter sp. PS3-L1]MDJ0321679.1 hypothetical protein [Pseudarthrobacter sp. PS3-L1]
MTLYAALIAGQDTITSHPTIEGAALEGTQAANTSPGTEYTIIQRFPNGEWHGLYNGKSVQEIVSGWA